MTKRPKSLPYHEHVAQEGHELDHTVEYRGTSQDYDGASEMVCTCGARFGRWTGKLLMPGELERRYGR
jgi:hypothetical protein